VADVAEHDGNGWVNCRCGFRHWGRHGAAGLLLLREAVPRPRAPQAVPAAGDASAVTAAPSRSPADPGQSPASLRGREVLLQLRAEWTHQGGRWGLPGGARDSHEDPVTAALREAAEEAGVGADDLTVLGSVPGVDHGDWCYTYVIALARRALVVSVRSAESDELRWVPLDAVHRLPLHPAFGDAWPRLRASLPDHDAQQADEN